MGQKNLACDPEPGSFALWSRALPGPGKALAYANGQGLRRDDAQAVQWMRKAAEQLEVEVHPGGSMQGNRELGGPMHVVRSLGRWMFCSKVCQAAFMMGEFYRQARSC